MIKLKNIKNIIFDFGGVIIDINHQLAENAFKDLGIKHFDKLYSQLVQNELFDKLERGFISAQNFRKKIKELIKIPVTDKEIDHAWNCLILDFPRERIKLLEKIKNKYRIFLLSNTNEIHYNLYIQKFKDEFKKDFSELFEKTYWSFKIGMRKPDKEIFEFIMNQNKLKPSETLFIDDSIQHIKGAKKMRINTYFLKKGEDIVDIFNI
ncbi:MAG: HAD family phosphatase [Bacteroidales bacterium]|nr:HAD family phosphatase [Bacteroidales bacterium]